MNQTSVFATLQRELDEPFALSQEHGERFSPEGYIKIKEVLPPEVLASFGQEITEQVFRLNTMDKPMSERTTYQKAFLQVMNLCDKARW